METEYNICVYRHINKSNGEVFYIGIGNSKRPYVKTNRSKEWLEYVVDNKYEVEVLYNNLIWKEAIRIEKELIKEIGRKDLGQGTLVNKSNGGEGQQTHSAWLETELIAEALKYNRRGDFWVGSRGAYKAADRHGILNQICSHMFSYPGKNSFKLTKEKCKEIALQFNRKTDLMKAKKSTYNAIIRQGWGEELFSHMEKPNN
jgi:hypothetical protein